MARGPTRGNGSSGKGQSMAAFAIRMNRLADTAEGKVNLIKIAAAIAADQAVVVATPVDTGRARSNWLAGIGAPNRFATDAKDPGPFDRSGGDSINKARAIVSRAKPRDKTLYISNNLVYISELNRGSSRQAPANYVRKAVQAAVARIRVLARGIFR